MAYGLALIAAAGMGPAYGQPTAGFSRYADTFYVQRPYNLQVSDRYKFENGTHTTWIYPTDQPFQQGNSTGPRTEMRWDNWADQRLEHLFEADVMYEPGTNHTCIMQIKSNTDGEPIYIQVHTGGDLRNSVSTPFLRNYAGKWFNLKAAFNPATGLGRAWIDDTLKVTRNYRTGTTGWYFKNGTYNNGMTAGSVSRAHFRNMKMWVKGGSTEIRPLARTRSVLPGGRIYDMRGKVWEPEGDYRGVAGIFPRPVMQSIALGEGGRK